MSKWANVFLLSAVMYCNISIDGSDILYGNAESAVKSALEGTSDDWYTMQEQLFRLPISEISEKVKDLKDFLNSSRGFLGLANHFKVPLNSVPKSYFKTHSFITSSEVHDEEQICNILIIHFCDETESKGVVSKFKIEFSTETHELVGSSAINDKAKLYFDLLKGGKWSMVLDEKYPNSHYMRRNAWDAAEDSKGIKEYSLFFYNCDHYVTEILKNSPESRQVIVGLRILIGGTLLSSSSSSALSSPAATAKAAKEVVSIAVVSTVKDTLIEKIIKYFKSNNIKLNSLHSWLEIFKKRVNFYYPESPVIDLIKDFMNALEKQINSESEIVTGKSC